MSTYADPYGSSAVSNSPSNISAGGLSHGVIAGLAILGAAVVTLLVVLYYGYHIRRKAKLRSRIDDNHAVGLQWTNVSYIVSTKANGRHKGGSFLRSWQRDSQSVSRRRAVEREHHHIAKQDIELQEPDSCSEANHVSFGSSSSVRKDQSVGENNILGHVTSQAMPGTLNFILGPSGAGKSSLVDILAGRQKTGQVQGLLATLHIEGGPSKAHHPTGHQIALVDQDDSVCLPGYMTVREMLSFSAELSLPENIPSAERSQIVDKVIHSLGLIEVAHSRIGDARNRGISGGERRRVSLGVALVGQPKVLIADECTSGLDAFSAHRVIKALRELACGENGGVTVIATLHQPSSQIFALADNVLLLGNGSVLFDGRPSQALDFCQSRGIPVPAGHNVADHLLTYAFHWRQQCEKVDIVESGQKREPLAIATWTSSVEERNSSPAGSHAASSSGGQQREAAKSAVITVPLDLNHGGSHTTTTFITQLHALLKRAVIMTKRDRLGALAHVGGAAVVSVFVGACFFQVKLNLGGFQNRVGSMFFIFIMILFMDLTAIVGLARVRLLMMRERANGLYSPWSWVTAHLALDLILLRAIPVIIMVSIVYWMVGLNHHASNFFLFILVAVLFSWTIAIYNMTISALVEEMGTTILLTSLFVLFNIFMAGFLMSLDSMPAVVRWLRWIAPAKYALEAVASNELKNLKFEDTFAGVPISTDVSLFANKLFGFQDGSYYRDLIVLACGFLIGFGVLLFSSVWWRMRELR